MASIPRNATRTPLKLAEIAPPAECELLDWLRTSVNREMLEEIAENDYGEEAPDHLSGLLEQLYGLTPPLGLPQWCPREVLELERWAEPDSAHGEVPATGDRGHLKRLLASTILLRNAGHVGNIERRSEEEFFIETSVATLIRFVDSASALGEDVPFRGLKFLAWFYDSQVSAIIRPFTAFCVLLLVATECKRFVGLDLSDLCEWCVTEEGVSRAAIAGDVASTAWLIGLSTSEVDPDRRRVWHDTTARILASAANCDHAASSCLAGLAARLAI